MQGQRTATQIDVGRVTEAVGGVREVRVVEVQGAVVDVHVGSASHAGQGTGVLQSNRTAIDQQISGERRAGIGQCGNRSASRAGEGERAFKSARKGAGVRVGHQGAGTQDPAPGSGDGGVTEQAADVLRLAV